MREGTKEKKGQSGKNIEREWGKEREKERMGKKTQKEEKISRKQEKERR